MSCNKYPINKNDIIIKEYQLRCNKRKGHKGMCEIVFTISWQGEVNK